MPTGLLNEYSNTLLLTIFTKWMLDSKSYRTRHHTTTFLLAIFYTRWILYVQNAFALTPPLPCPILSSSMLTLQPKQVQDIKQFLSISRRKDVQGARIKKNGTQTKFKIRCSRYLYTLVVNDPERAEKLKQSLPPSTFVERS